jgi:polygalacturonase
MKRKKKILISVLLALVIQAVGAQEFNILDFGAVRNQLSTPGIQKAINDCHESGGGTVVIPAGVFITGTVILKSNINLYLEQGAELRSSENMGDFSSGEERYGMIFCEDAANVSITGKGVINAMGSRFYDPDKNHTDSSGPGVKKDYDKMFTRQKENYLPEFFTHGIECHEVKDLLIDGFTGSANPNSPKSQKLLMEMCTIRQ